MTAIWPSSARYIWRVEPLTARLISACSSPPSLPSSVRSCAPSSTSSPRFERAYFSAQLYRKLAHFSAKLE